MMNRRFLIAGLLAATVLPGSAFAQSYADRIVQQLRQQGYSGITVSNTWLGRTRIVARSSNGSREIIIDPRTGEILRDLSEGGGGNQGIIENRSGSGNGRGNDDDDRDDDHGDDDDNGDDGDHSGSGGGGNSGGGGGGNSGGGGSGGSGGGDDDDDDDGDDGDDGDD